MVCITHTNGNSCRLQKCWLPTFHLVEWAGLSKLKGQLKSHVALTLWSQRRCFLNVDLQMKFLIEWKQKESGKFTIVLCLLQLCSKCKYGCTKAVNKHQWLWTNVVLMAKKKIVCWRSWRPFIYIVMLMAYLKGFLTSFTHEVHFACHTGRHSACESFSLLESNSGGINSPLESGQQRHCPTVITSWKGSRDPLKHKHTHTHILTQPCKTNDWNRA